jgi:hypothetical protein
MLMRSNVGPQLSNSWNIWSRPPLKRSKVMYQEEIPFGAAGAIFLRSQAKESRKTERIYTVFPDARLLYSCQTESLKS